MRRLDLYRTLRNAIVVFLSSLLFLSSCLEDPDVPKTIKIAISSSKNFTRALGEANTDPKTVEFKTIKLYFWGKGGTQLVAPYTLSFGEGSPELENIKTNGYEINVSPAVKYISAECNFQGKEETNILNLQSANAFDKFPYFTSKVDLANAYQRNGRYILQLNPKPHIARIEIVGKITPPLNSSNYSAYGEVELTGVYINNFKKHRDDQKRIMFKASDYDKNRKEWKNFPNAMQHLASYDISNQISSGDYAEFFHVWPSKVKKPEELEHVILRLTINGKPNYFLTINRFKEKSSGNPLTEIKAGKIYRIDISLLSDLFKTKDDGKKEDDPTTEDPEPISIMVDGIVEDPDELPPLVSE